MGALAALLTVAGLGRFQLRPASILLLLFTLTGILVERGAALIFKDTSVERFSPHKIDSFRTVTLLPRIISLR